MGTKQINDETPVGRFHNYKCSLHTVSILISEANGRVLLTASQQILVLYSHYDINCDFTANILVCWLL